MWKMKKYLLVDYLNMAWRIRHAHANNPIDLQIGLAYHSIFNSIRYVYKHFGADHLVVCKEGKSWRKGVSQTYKLNRVVNEMKKTQREREDDQLFFEALEGFCAFLDTKTNASVIQCPVAEADDLIAIFTQSHPTDQHVIISTDADYMQLLAQNVKIYNGVKEELITVDGYFDLKGNSVIDKKTALPKGVPDPEFLLFEKCIRGDKGDNVMPAYPGARMKGTKNKVGIIEAYEDRHNKGYNYNNFMLQKYTDDKGVEHRVLDRYLENQTLVDLTRQPEDVRMACLESIAAATQKEKVSNVGVHFLRFCKEHELNRLSQYPNEFATILNSRY